MQTLYIRRSTTKNVLSADLLPNSTLLEICLRQPGYHIRDFTTVHFFVLPRIPRITTKGEGKISEIRAIRGEKTQLAISKTGLLEKCPVATQGSENQGLGNQQPDVRLARRCGFDELGAGTDCSRITVTVIFHPKAQHVLNPHSIISCHSSVGFHTVIPATRSKSLSFVTRSEMASICITARCKASFERSLCRRISAHNVFAHSP